jgi:hypothetical protein
MDNNVEGLFAPEHEMGQWRDRSMPFLNRSTEFKSVVCLNLRLLYPRGKDPLLPIE